MGKQDVIGVCSQCKSELQHEVKYCPFCGKMQAATDSTITPVNVSQSETIPPIILNEPDETTQEDLQNQASPDSVEVEALVREEPTTPQSSTRIPIPIPQPQPQPQHSHHTAISEPSKPNNFKYVIGAFVVILVVVFAVFNGDDKSVAPPTESVVKTADNSCETAINEINQHLHVSKPSRALTVIQIYQADCKNNKQFIALAITAENQANTAKAKLTLAKEYLQKNNLEMAGAAAKNALEVDSELVGGNELLQEIDELKKQKQNEILQANENVQMQADVIADTQDQVAFDQVKNQNSAEKLKQENLNLQKALQDAQRKRDEGSVEIAKQRAAERQKAEQAKTQNEQQFSSALSSANKALKLKSYGTAKRIAKEVLALSPNNSSALKVLRQAEEGEAKAFDEMIIE